MKKLIPLLFLLISCNQNFYVEDTKFLHEQYLCMDDLRARDFNNIELKFINDGFTVDYDYIPGDPVKVYMILTPAMIEHTRKGKGILKKRHIRKLKNTL